MNQRNKLKFCAIIYTFLIILVITLVLCFQTYDSYFRFGVPNSNQVPLLVLSVKIDNYYKYVALLGLITLIRVVKVLVSEIADAVLSFTIYNPDKKNITELTKCELQFYGNYIYMIDSLRYVFTLMITITQIDLALYGIIVDQITTLFTIRMLLNEKTFNKTEDLSEQSDEENEDFSNSNLYNQIL